MTIGVFGTWGSGKTSIMKMVKKQLPKKYTVAWFDAWKYDKEETLWRVLLLQVLSGIRKAIPEKNTNDLEEINDLETSLYAPVDREKVGRMTIEWGKMGKGLAQGAMQIGLGFLPGGTVINDLIKEFRNTDKSEQAVANLLSSVHRESAKIHIDQIKFLEQFHERFTNLVNKHVVKKKHRLVVFVDDLDRYLPEKAIEILEAIKLFLDAPGCVFVLGIDQEVISRGIKMKYREFLGKKDIDDPSDFTIDGMKYLEKIIQLPFQIPPVEQADMGDFVQKLRADWPDEECPKVFSVGLGDNPRKIKRTVNVFLMLWNLAEKRKVKLEGRIKPIRLAKVVAIQAIFPELYNLIKEEPRYLGALEDYFRTFDFGGFVNTGDGREEVKIERDLPPALAPFISNQAVERILTMHFLNFPDANFTGS